MTNGPPGDPEAVDGDAVPRPLVVVGEAPAGRAERVRAGGDVQPLVGAGQRR
jgi:hypothetical protein